MANPSTAAREANSRFFYGESREPIDTREMPTLPYRVMRWDGSEWVLVARAPSEEAFERLAKRMGGRFELRKGRADKVVREATFK
jgi:hypothetical protein